MKLRQLFMIILTLSCVTVLVDTSYLRACRRSRFELDVVIAFGISPVADAFPYNLFPNSRTPTSVSSFTKALLGIFDYLPTKISLVSFNDEFKQITGFTNNRNRLWSVFSRWQPTSGQPSLTMAFKNIRPVFTDQGRSRSRRILIVITDHTPLAPGDAEVGAGFLRSDKVDILMVGYGDAYTNLNQLRQMTGVNQRAMGVSNTYYLPRMVGNIQRIICAMLRVTVPVYPDPPTTTLATTIVASLGKATDKIVPISPIRDELVILADDSESTRDFLGLEYFYNNDSRRFLDSVISNTDYTRCRVAVYLFSNDIRGLQGNLTTSRQALRQALNGLKSSDNSFSTTNTAQAITQAALVLSSSPIPTSNKYIIIMTDGQPDDVDRAVLAAISARSSGIKIGIVLSPLFDGQISYRLSDIQRIIDSSQGDAIKVLDSRAQLSSMVSSGFCPVASNIFQK